jgi:hypothetical protein
MIELSGIDALGNAVFVAVGAVIADVVKVKTPEVDTLYDDTAVPLNKNVKSAGKATS